MKESTETKPKSSSACSVFFRLFTLLIISYFFRTRNIRALFFGGADIGNVSLFLHIGGVENGSSAALQPCEAVC